MRKNPIPLTTPWKIFPNEIDEPLRSIDVLNYNYRFFVLIHRLKQFLNEDENATLILSDRLKYVLIEVWILDVNSVEVLLTEERRKMLQEVIDQIIEKEITTVPIYATSTEEEKERLNVVLPYLPKSFKLEWENSNLLVADFRFFDVDYKKSYNELHCALYGIAVSDIRYKVFFSKIRSNVNVINEEFYQDFLSINNYIKK